MLILFLRTVTFFLQNTIIDERASLSVSSIIPGPLMGLLRSVKKVSSAPI